MKVAFYKNTQRPGLAGLFDALIRRVTHGPYSHCELVFVNGDAYSSSIQDGGCRWKRICFDPEKWDFIELPEIAQTSRIRMANFCDDELGCGYDFPGVFRFLCSRIRESKNRWFCSEIVCAALQEGGRLWGINTWQVHPSKLYELLSDRSLSGVEGTPNA